MGDEDDRVAAEVSMRYGAEVANEEFVGSGKREVMNMDSKLVIDGKRFGLEEVVPETEKGELNVRFQFTAYGLSDVDGLRKAVKQVFPHKRRLEIVTDDVIAVETRSLVMTPEPAAYYAEEFVDAVKERGGYVSVMCAASSWGVVINVAATW